MKNATSYELAQNLSSIHIVGTKEILNEVDKEKATISVVNTKELNQVFVYKFNKAMKKLNKYLKKNPVAKLSLIHRLQNTPSFLGNSRDLSSFIGEIQKYLLENKEYALYDRFDEALRGLKESIMSYGYGDQYLKANGYYLGYFKAFGVWFPGNDRDFQNRSQNFEKSLLYQNAPAWADFIFDLFRPIKPVFSF